MFTTMVKDFTKDDMCHCFDCMFLTRFVNYFQHNNGNHVIKLRCFMLMLSLTSTTFNYYQTLFLMINYWDNRAKVLRKNYGH